MIDLSHLPLIIAGSSWQEWSPLTPR
jgi:hypothetical protein